MEWDQTRTDHMTVSDQRCYRNAKGVLKKEYLHSYFRDLRYNV